MKVSSILGLNARTQLYSYRYNRPSAKGVAGSKLLTKRVLRKAGVPIPKIYGKFSDPVDIIKFNWKKLPSSFALKPSKGLGGEGIIVVKKRSKDGEGWITTQRKRVTIDDLKFHVMDVIEGAYSLGNVPDIAFFEEYVGRHKSFRKYAYRGTPDIRVIVFNRVPVMAMLRLPTKESGGRANLHQGAIGVGLDIATGITTRAIWHDEVIKFKPDSKKKLHGIKVPHWTEMLEVAVRCQDATALGYVGVDIVLHPEHGPMVLEINSQPGLAIQLANNAGLKKRLERVDELEVRSAEHGVRIAKALFAASFSDRVKAEEGIKTVSAMEEIKLRDKLGNKHTVKAKIDTGAWRTSISEDLANKMGLLDKENVLWFKRVKSSLGSEERPVINLTFWLAGKKISTPASVAKRMTLKFPIIIGRKSLKGFLIDPHIQDREKLPKIKKSASK